jgi:hypothetical protein
LPLYVANGGAAAFIFWGSSFPMRSKYTVLL